MPIREYVPPKGDPSSPIALIGESPALNEMRLGEPFVGAAGENLNECLHAAGIYRTQCYITNAIKWGNKPVSEFVRILPKRRFEVTPKGRQAFEELKEELSSCEANVFVALGNTALIALCDRVGIRSWRGSILESTLLPGRKVIPCIHPAVYTWEKLRVNPDAYLDRYLISMDLRRAKEQSSFPEFRLTDRQFHLRPTFYEAMDYIETCIKMAQKGLVIDYDIELTPFSQELSCIGLAWTSYEAMCIPFVGPDGDWFNPEQEAQIMLKLEELMSNPDYVKRGQYVIFDSHFLLRKYGIRTHSLQDTMVAQKILYPEFRVGLDFITAMWTDIPYYKQDGKIWIEGSGQWDIGWRYNCLDVLSTAEAHPKQLAELREEGNEGTYERQVKLIEPLTYMMERGVKVNTEGMKQAAWRHTKEIEELQSILDEMVGRPLNPNSPKQLIEYFYVERRLTPYTKDKKLTVNEDALKRLSRKGVKEASIILDMRKLRKRVGTYLKLDKVDPDGRLRCSYNPVGTKFSRISSSENIFGTGTNLQNWPNDILRYLEPDSGYIYYSFDLSQFENRVVAYVGNIPQMIRVFEEGLDSHRMTAALIFQKPYEEISDEDGSSTLGNGERSERYWGKTGNHAFNYGFSARSFALKYEIPEAQGKWIYEAYHSAYPGLRDNYWAYCEDSLRDDRSLTNLFGRKVKFYGKWGEKLLHVAYSCIPQGTCGDLINERGIEYTYYSVDADFEPVELLLQVHDSIGFQIPLSVGFMRHARILRKIKNSLSTPLRFKDREFAVPVDLTVGLNLFKADGKEYKGNQIPDSDEDFASLLERTYEDLIPF